jgi:hypothetical protein
MADGPYPNRPQFTGEPPAGLIKRVFVDDNVAGGRETPEGLGLLSNAPLRPAPHGSPGPTSISSSVKAALPGLGEEKAARVRDVVTRKGRW